MIITESWLPQLSLLKWIPITWTLYCFGGAGDFTIVWHSVSCYPTFISHRLPGPSLTASQLGFLNSTPSCLLISISTHIVVTRKKMPLRITVPIWLGLTLKTWVGSFVGDCPNILVGLEPEVNDLTFDWRERIHTGEILRTKLVGKLFPSSQMVSNVILTMTFFLFGVWASTVTIGIVGGLVLVSSKCTSICRYWNSLHRMA